MDLGEAPFLIDAAKINDFQNCRRRYLLSTKWRPVRWHGKQLMDACLRQGILDLGSGKPLKDVIQAASTRFMNTAANSGLNVSGVDPFTIAQDWVAVLETILTALDKRPKPKLSPVPSVKIASGIEWTFLSYADEREHLHRTITVDRWDEDRLAQEMHSWFVFGDVAAARKPLHLQVIVIGQMRDGRRHSPWARAYQHEYVRGRLRFQKKKDGAKKGTYTELEGSWSPVYLADSNSYNAETWVELMEKDSIIDSLIHNIEITVPKTEHLKAFKRDVEVEARQMMEWMDNIDNPMNVPMSRSACDVPVCCNFQPLCFSPIIDVDISTLGMYKPRHEGT